VSKSSDHYRELTQSVSAGLATLRSGTPEVMKSFNDLGRAATANGVLDKKTKELIALALSVAARCDPCIGFHMQSLVKLGRHGRRSTRRSASRPTWVAVLR